MIFVTKSIIACFSRLSTSVFWAFFSKIFADSLALFSMVNFISPYLLNTLKISTVQVKLLRGFTAQEEEEF